MNNSFSVRDLLPYLDSDSAVAEICVKDPAASSFKGVCLGELRDSRMVLSNQERYLTVDYPRAHTRR